MNYKDLLTCTLADLLKLGYVYQDSDGVIRPTDKTLEE